MTQQSDAHAHVAQTRPPFECIALVLQGGGALGAYQAGVYQALDAANLAPDWICGISIGAFNSAIIAGNPPGARVDKLREFWESITQPYVDWEQPPGWEIAEAEAAAAASLAPQSSDFWTLACKWVPGLNADTSRGFLNQWSAGRVLWNGTPGFFALRPVTPWFWPGTSVRATSYYDTTALKSTLERVRPYWDARIAPSLAAGERLLVAAHGNSLRAIVKLLFDVSDAAIPAVEIPTGNPLLIDLDAALKPVRSRYLDADRAQPLPA